MHLFQRIRNRAVAWLARELADEKKRSGYVGACHCEEGATLLPEAEVHNHAGGPERITLGRNTFVRGRLLTYGHGGRISIGEWCYVGARMEIWSMDSITIGNRVLISHNVNIHDGTAHPPDPTDRHAHFRHIIESGHPKSIHELPGMKSAPIVIEDDVWISFNVTILRGVRIGRGSVIAAGSLVTRDVPPGHLYRCSVSPVLTPLQDQGSGTFATDADQA